MCQILSLVDLCRGHTVYIQTHNYPDPDAIASAFGLQTLLARQGVPSTLCYEGRIDKLSASRMLGAFGIRMVPYDQLREAMQPQDYIICVDAQKLSGNITDFTGDEVACIDHHPVFVPMEYRYQDIRQAGACSTLIAGYFRDLGLDPDPDTAAALLYGLKMDTLQFTRGVTEADIEMFEFLFRFCDREKLSRLERNNLEFRDLKAYGAAIANIQLYEKAGFSYVPFSCPDALVAILSDFILALVEVDVAVVFCRREDGMKFSVRSEVPAVHAGRLIREALQGVGSGGGHAVMAGGMILPEQLPLLGPCPEARVRELFLRVLAAPRDGGTPGLADPA